MYAAAGGASIAKRREQKRLQLKHPGGITPAAKKTTATASAGTQGTQQKKNSRSHLAPLHPAAPTGAFHSSHENHRHSHHFHHSHQHRRKRPEPIPPNRLAPPVSPIQFPISPPPLSLESPNSISLPLKSNNFPFPPPSFLDLRVTSPTASELQCGSQGPGKAAWQSCNRPSPLPLSPASPNSSRDGYKTKQCEAHRRWMKRNRIRDASYCYGSSGEDEDAEGSSLSNRRRGEVNAAVNTVLYAGLGTTALGLVISFVGTGEKGFLSPELRLVGPTLLCAGLLCCLLRVLLCLCLCRCCGDCRWTPCRVVIVDKDKMRKTEKKGTSSQTTASLLPRSSQQTMSATINRPVTAPAANKISRNKAIPSSSSSMTKGHELLLSPSQLPE